MPIPKRSASPPSNGTKAQPGRAYRRGRLPDPDELAARLALGAAITVRSLLPTHPRA